ncbi:MAG TPA: RsmE family RNA methyltransferase [Candidatus Eisenbacteria bacterium]|jgi:16S rRNA (uracil1498-N3)-methyltransferase|nr:RsmE family RNA methyltransferase [Candidatus Eisenbacteria bacterium]
MSAGERARHAGAPSRIVVDDLGGTHIAIEGTEADHLRKALRVRPGEHVTATDGRGTRATLEVTGFHKHVIEARVIARREEPMPRHRLWLATAADGPRFDWLVEKSVELGAFGLLALASGHGGKPRTDRWERVARAALGQSLGSWALALGITPGAEEAVEAGEPGGGAWETVQVADPDGAGAEPGPPGLAREGAHLLLAGPPEGFSERDRDFLRRLPGAGRIRLGERRLRSETAALALLVWARLQAEKGP